VHTSRRGSGSSSHRDNRKSRVLSRSSIGRSTRKSGRTRSQGEE